MDIAQSTAVEIFKRWPLPDDELEDIIRDAIWEAIKFCDIHGLAAQSGQCVKNPATGVYDQTTPEFQQAIRRIGRQANHELLKSCRDLLAHLNTHTRDIETCDLPDSTLRVMEDAAAVIRKSEGGVA